MKVNHLHLSIEVSRISFPESPVRGTGQVGLYHKRAMHRFIPNLTETIKKLPKLVTQLEKLIIGVISIAGWTKPGTDAIILR